jgi:hypothetical protein
MLHSRALKFRKWNERDIGKLHTSVSVSRGPSIFRVVLPKYNGEVEFRDMSSLVIGEFCCPRFVNFCNAPGTALPEHGRSSQLVLLKDQTRFE